MSSLCHLAYCGRHKSEQWCLSRGSLYAHLHWFGSSIHETGTLFIHTHYSTKLAVIPSYAMGPGNIAENATKKPTHPFVWAPAHTCHLPGLVIIIIIMPVRWHTRGKGVGVRACVHAGGLYVWVGVPPGTLFVKLVNSRRSPLQTGCLYTEVQGPVSCCAFMQLWPFWHKCALTTGAAPS